MVSKFFNKKDWPVVRFGDVVKNVNETKREPLKAGLERLVGLDCLDPENLRISRWGMIVDGTSFTKRFRKGQVLFGKRRAYQRKVAVAEWDGICSGDILTFEPKDDKLLPELLPFIVQSDSFFEHALGTSAGSLSPRTKWTLLKEYEFPLPPKQEQKKIANILWAAENSINNYVSLADRAKKAQTAYENDILKLGALLKKETKLPTGWKMGFLSELVHIDPKVPKELPTDKEVSFVTMTDIAELGGIMNQEERQVSEVRKGFTYFAEGDVLFAKITPCMENGKGAIAKGLKNKNGFGSTEFFVLRPKDKNDTDFAYHVSMSPLFRIMAKRWMRGSAGQLRVPKDFFEQWPIAIPPATERKKIANLLNQYSKSIDYALCNIAKQKELQKSLREQILCKEN